MPLDQALRREIFSTASCRIRKFQILFHRLYTVTLQQYLPRPDLAVIEPGRRATPCDLSRIPGPAALYFDNVSDMRIITRGASAKQLPALVAWPGRYLKRGFCMKRFSA